MRPVPNTASARQAPPRTRPARRTPPGDWAFSGFQQRMHPVTGSDQGVDRHRRLTSVTIRLSTTVFRLLDEADRAAGQPQEIGVAATPVTLKLNDRRLLTHSHQSEAQDRLSDSAADRLRPVDACRDRRTAPTRRSSPPRCGWAEVGDDWFLGVDLFDRSVPSEGPSGRCRSHSARFVLLIWRSAASVVVAYASAARSSTTCVSAGWRAVSRHFYGSEVGVRVPSGAPDS
jgi:hypothetical protein